MDGLAAQIRLEVETVSLGTPLCGRHDLPPLHWQRDQRIVTCSRYTSEEYDTLIEDGRLQLCNNVIDGLSPRRRQCPIKLSIQRSEECFRRHVEDQA